MFSVREGQIHVSGEEFGALTTCGNFRDYHLIAEWRWGQKTWPPREKNAADSGILLHCVGADGAAGGGWMESIECQIIEGGCGDLLMVGGRNKPRLTCEIRTGADGQPYYQKGGMPRPATPADSTGGDATRAGRTPRDSGARMTSSSRPGSGTAWRSSATATPSRISSTAGS